LEPEGLASVSELASGSRAKVSLLELVSRSALVSASVLELVSRSAVVSASV
jgi:hypothetical protein